MGPLDETNTTAAYSESTMKQEWLSFPIDILAEICTCALSLLQIADFGMSIELMNSSYYISSGGKIPVKWTAPEALDSKRYSVASDIWSFGCVLYEIWSMGKKPFFDKDNLEVSMYIMQRWQ